jgi:hypothetical protein
MEGGFISSKWGLLNVMIAHNGNGNIEQEQEISSCIQTVPEPCLYLVVFSLHSKDLGTLRINIVQDIV